MPYIPPRNETDYILDQDETESVADVTADVENSANYKSYEYTGPDDIGVPDETPSETPETQDDLAPTGDEVTEPYYMVYYRIRVPLDNYEPAYLQELAEGGATFYAIYDDDSEEVVDWHDITSLDPEGEIVDFSDAIASATNQHFWDDSNGAHVGEMTHEDWDSAVSNNFSDLSASKNYYNILLNSLGVLLRRALYTLVSISRGGIAFYDGLGNETTNIMSYFGRDSAQIGRENGKHLVINNDGITVYNGDGTVAPLNASNINAVQATINELIAGSVTTETLRAASAYIAALSAANVSASDISADKATINSLVSGSVTTETLRAASAYIAALEAASVSANDISADKATLGELVAGDVTTTTLRAASAYIAALSSASISASDISADHATIGSLDATYATIDNLNAVTARIGTLETDNTDVKGRLTAAEGDIDTLEATKATIADLNAATARIGDLETDNVSVKGRITAAEADVDNLQAATADIDTIRANSAKVANLTAAELEADHATIGALDTNYAQVNLANVDNAWIENGTVKDGAITNAMINSVSANKLTAGTIDASNITVTNLNADNITAGTINGERIGNGSLSLSKLEEDVYTETEVDGIVQNLQTQIDGAIETWTGTDVPTLQNVPAVNWNTNSIKDTHVGDVYFVVNSQSQQNGYNYRFTKSGNTYSWQLIKDNDVTNALQRLTDAEGRITQFTSDISQLQTDTGTLTTKTTSLETRMSDAEADILDKVDTATFNLVSDTVDSHSQSITQMTTTLSNKADNSTVTSVTNRVSKNEQDISGINTTIGELQDTLETKADGSTVETVSNRLNTVSNTVDGHTQSLQSVTQTQTTIQKNAVKSTVQLWFTKANTTAPNKPTAHVTTNNAATSNAWNLAVPTYNSAYPNYYYCYEYQYVDGSYGWSAVTRDIATGEMQATARQAQDDIDNLEIGGRNLFTWPPSGTKWKDEEHALNTYRNQGSFTQFAGSLLFDPSETVGEQYTISFWAKSPNGTTALQIYNDNSKPKYFWFPAATLATALGNEWEFFSRTVTNIEYRGGNTPSTDENHWRRIEIYAPAATGVLVKQIKVEKGTKATDWTPAPEDVDADISTAQTSADNAQATANKNIKESQQLWFTKVNDSAPSKPTSKVTSTSTGANAWTTKVPTYNASSPYYFYCMQYVAADGTVTWSDVVYDRATTEAQSVARTTSANLTTLQQDYATFKQTTQNFESTIGTTYATKTELGEAVDNRVVVDGEFLYRTTGGGQYVPSGRATVTAIKGRTLVWNQLASIAKPASDRTVNGVTITNNNDGTFTLNGTASAVTVFNIGDVTVGTSNHKILVKGCPSDGAASRYRLKDGYGVNSDLGSGVIDQVPNNKTIAQILVGSGYTCDNLVFRPQLFDLTAMFGAGNEPSTVAEFESMFPEPYYPYDAGSLLPVRMTGVETTGFNQWDTDTSGAQYLGHYYIEGETYNYVKRENSNYDCYRVPVFPSTEYCISADSGTLGSIANKRYVDASSNFISGDVVGWNALYGVFTTPSTARYIEVSVPVGTTKKLCINISNPTRNGEYEPYWSEQRAIPASTYFPDGMRSAGSVYDELIETQAVTRVEEFIFNGANYKPWISSTDGDYVVFGLTTSGTGNGIVSAQATTVGALTQLKAIPFGICTTGAQSRVYFTLSENETTAQQAMDYLAQHPITAHIALATPTTTTFDTPLNLTYKAEQGGTERIMVDATLAAPQSAPVPMLVQYGINIYEMAAEDALRTASIETRVTNAETSITQTNNQIALKANSSDVYTKTESDGLISTEVANRNAAITAKANEITSSVSETYATKTVVNGKADASDVTALAGRVTTAESSITQNAQNIESKVSKDGVISSINQSAESVKIQASKVEIDGTAVFNAIKSSTDAAYDAKGAAATVQSNIDELEIGGRNLLGNTENRSGSAIVESTAVSSTFGNIGNYNDSVSIYSLVDYDGSSNAVSCATSTSTRNRGVGWWTKQGEIRAGEKYTFSCRIKCSIATSIHMHTAWRNSSATSGYTGWTSEGTKAIVANTWTDYSCTFIPNSNAKLDWELFVAICITGSSNGATYQVAHAKLEKGNKATDWSPAPEDLQSNAVKRTQRIWYRKSASGAPPTPGTASSNWVTKADDGNDAWTKMHIAISGTHKYIYTCEQYEMANGTVGYTSVLLDNTITVIDGGNIITGSVTANKLNAADINASKSLTIGAFQQSTQDVISNDKIEVGGRNLLLGTADYAGWYIPTSANASVNGEILSFAAVSSRTWRSCTSLPSLPFELIKDRSFTVSCEARGHNVSQMETKGVLYLVVQGVASETGTSGCIYYEKNTHFAKTDLAEGEWVRLSGTFVRDVSQWNIQSGHTFDEVTHFNIAVYAYTTQPVECRRIKLEVGNKVTDWTPAPEDVDADISAAAKTATNYITHVDNNGITVHPSGTTASRLQISSNGTTVYQNNTDVAFYGAFIRIGKEHIDGSDNNQSYMVSDYHSLQLIDRENNPYFYVSDLRDASGEAELEETFLGDGSTQIFTVGFDILTIVSATESSHSSSSYSKYSDKQVRFGTIPASGATVTIVYKTRSNKTKAYTIGTRSSNSRIGAYSYSEGYQNIAKGQYSHAEGSYTRANGIYSHAEGYYTEANGTYSHAEGYDTEAWNVCHAEGTQTTASGRSSHAEGNKTTASNACSHAEGYDTVASGIYSHAEGRETTASNWNSHAEGGYTIADGYSSHAEGYHGTASGNYSHAEGYYTTTSGLYSHAQNEGTIAASSSQTAIGQYNIEDTSGTYSLIIGNGSSDTTRSNALTVDWNGDVDAGRYLNFNHRNSDAVSSAIGNPPSEAQYYGSICTYDVDGARNFYCQTSHITNDNLYQSFVLNRLNGNTTIQNGFYIGIDASGDSYVNFTSGGDAAWRSGLGLGSLATKSSLVANDIPSLAASKINSGTFDAARIPNSMAADKIVSTSPTNLSLNSATNAYSSGKTPKYRKWGNVVQVYGAVSPKTEVAAGGSLTIGTLPSGYRPAMDIEFLCQGSGNATWLLHVGSDGVMTASRYRSGASANAAMPTNAWLTFSATFIVG